MRIRDGGADFVLWRGRFDVRQPLWLHENRKTQSIFEFVFRSFSTACRKTGPQRLAMTPRSAGRRPVASRARPVEKVFDGDAPVAAPPNVIES
jgi:hypothetical protein